MVNNNIYSNINKTTMKIIACVTCNERDTPMLAPFLAAWGSMNTGISLVVLSDINSPVTNGRNLPTYPWDNPRDRNLSKWPSLLRALDRVAEIEGADAIIKLDPDYIHQDITWLTEDTSPDVVCLSEAHDPNKFSGAALFMKREAVTRILDRLDSSRELNYTLDWDFLRSAVELGLDCSAVIMDEIVHFCDPEDEYRPHLFDEVPSIHCGQFGPCRMGRARASFLMKRINLHRGTTKHRKAIVYPIANGNEGDCDLDLIFSLRSVHENMEEDVPIFIMSEKIPPNVSGEVSFVLVSGYLDALRKACAVADEFLWMNDDIYMLRSHRWEEFREWFVSSKQWSDEKIASTLEHSNKWQMRKASIMNELNQRGYTTFDFSSHTPYLYESPKMRLILDDFCFGYKSAFETAYGNFYGVPHRKRGRKLQRYHRSLLPLDASGYDLMNHNDKGATDHLRGFLLGKFPAPSPYESHSLGDLSSALLSEIP